MTPQQRSHAMSRVRGRETKIERLVRSLLHKQGFRFRKNVFNLPGKPDIVLPKYHAAILIHGCFWHGHAECKRGYLPTSRREFWVNKISKTVIRDKENINELMEKGWRVAIVWQCALKNRQSINNTIGILTRWIVCNEDWLEISDAPSTPRTNTASSSIL